MGYAVGGQCFRDPVEATQAYCSSFGGVTAQGQMRCTGADWDGAGISYSYEVVAPDGNYLGFSSYAEPIACTPQDLEEWSPTIAAWFLALVVILAARSVHTKVFNRESY